MNFSIKFRSLPTAKNLGDLPRGHDVTKRTDRRASGRINGWIGQLTAIIPRAAKKLTLFFRMLESNYIARHRLLHSYPNERSLTRSNYSSYHHESSLHAKASAAASVQPWFYDTLYAQRQHPLHRSAMSLTKQLGAKNDVLPVAVRP